MDEVMPADSLSTPTTYAPADRAAAYDLFLNRAMSLDDVAIVQGLDRNVIAGWAKQGKWVARKKALLDDMNKSIEQKFRDWVTDNKIKVAQQHLSYGQTLENMIKEILDKAKKENQVSSVELARLAKALSEASNLSARAVGLDNEGVSTIAQQQQTQKQPLIIIGLKPVRNDGGATLEADYTEGEA